MRQHTGHTGVTFFLRLTALALLLHGTCAYALSTVEHSFDELVARSEQILVGTVKHIDSTWGRDSHADTIFSTIHLTDIETIKGPAAGSVYRLRVAGGVVGDQAQFYPGLPRFENDRRYLLFIRGNQRAMFPITGVSQGFYRIQWDDAQQREVAIPASGNHAAPVNRSLNGQPQGESPRDLQGLIGDIRTAMARGN